MKFEMDGQIAWMNHASSHAPAWEFLSENLQQSLVQYLFSVGVHPNIGLCVEYLTWNKEQRLYLQWLRDIYFMLFFNDLPQNKLSINNLNTKRLE
jgi:hypothetical protein